MCAAVLRMQTASTMQASINFEIQNCASRWNSPSRTFCFQFSTRLLGKISFPLRPDYTCTGEGSCAFEVLQHPAAKEHDRTRRMLGKLLRPQTEATVAIDNWRDVLSNKVNPLRLRNKDRHIPPATNSVSGYCRSRSLSISLPHRHRR